MFPKSICRMVLLLGFGLVAAKCFGQQFNYAPNNIYYCQLQNKYDSSLGIGLRRGSDANGSEWQAAFSPVKHGAVLVNYFNGYHKDIKKQEAEGSSMQFVEVGLGAYETLAHSTASLFVGYGQGAIFSNYFQDRTASFDLQRWFVQPAVTFRNQNFECGLALRFSRLIYTRGEIDFSLEESDIRPIFAIQAKSPFFLPEFGLHAGFVLKPCTFSLNLTSLFYNANQFNFERLNTTFLLTTDLSVFYRRKKPKAE